MYSRQASSIWSQIASSSSPVVILSPDNTSEVSARYLKTPGNGRVVLTVSGKIGSLQVDLGPGVGSELLWSPDSKSFFVTTSDQGANGTYRLIVVGRWNGVLQSKDLTPLISKQFGHPVLCGWPEVPNVAGIAWIQRSHDVLAAAEIVNHSNCDSFGTFRAYEIDPAQMKTVRTFDQLEAKEMFGSYLGVEPRNAPDECIRRPEACYVSTNHPADGAKP